MSLFPRRNTAAERLATCAYWVPTLRFNRPLLYIRRSLTSCACAQVCIGNTRQSDPQAMLLFLQLTQIYKPFDMPHLVYAGLNE